MGYIFLSASVLSSAIKSFLSKKVSDKTASLNEAVFANVIRMGFVTVFAFFLVAVGGNINTLAIGTDGLVISLVTGCLTAIFTVSWLMCLRKSAFMAAEAFMSVGTVLPTLFSYLFYGEEITISQAISQLLLVFSVIFMTVYSKDIKGKIGAKTFVILFIVGISSGMTDFMNKVFVKVCSPFYAASFNFYIGVFALIILSVAELFFLRSGYKIKRESFNLKSVYVIAVMAVFLLFGSYFKTLASDLLPSVKLYPVMRGASLVLATATSAVFFKEKLKPIGVIGVSALIISAFLA